MEIFELKYFLGVARHENIHRASRDLRVSPASLSKAVSRLESELSIKLFRRAGRGIQLTDPGRLLQRRASEIIELESSARAALGSSDLNQAPLQAILAGPEVLLTRAGLDVCARIQARHAGSRFELQICDEAEALEKLAKGEVHLAVVTSSDISTRTTRARAQLTSRVLADSRFRVYAGLGHPLYEQARLGRSIPVEKVLAHGFASPDRPILGEVGLKQSYDGWRDDRFPRRVDFVTSGLKLLEELVCSGRALAYLPEAFSERLPLKALKITGCPYVCVQTIRLVARNPRETSWIHQLF